MVKEHVMKHTIANELEDLRKLSDKKLIEKKHELMIMLIGCEPHVISPKVLPRKRGMLRRSIARINTIMGERGRRGVLKEEKRL